MKSHVPSPSALRKILRYDQHTGQLFWLRRPAHMFASDRACILWNGRFAEKEAFTANSYGYRQGHALNTKLSAHRVAWALHYGNWPVHQIDHINGNRSDNRIANLREASCSEQRQNSAISSANTSGVVGVCWHKKTKKWRAVITVNKRQIALGYFHNHLDAVRARKSAERRYGFHPNHGRQKSEG